MQGYFHWWSWSLQRIFYFDTFAFAWTSISCWWPGQGLAKPWGSSGPCVVLLALDDGALSTHASIPSPFALQRIELILILIPEKDFLLWHFCIQLNFYIMISGWPGWPPWGSSRPCVVLLALDDSALSTHASIPSPARDITKLTFSPYSHLDNDLCFFYHLQMYSYSDCCLTYYVVLGASESEIAHSMALFEELKRTPEKLLHRFVMYSVLGPQREIVVGLGRDPWR